MKKERLESFQHFEVDPSKDLWKKIEAELPAKKKRRWFLIWIFSAIVISVTGIKYFMKDHSASVISHIENKKQNIPPVEMSSETIQAANNLISRSKINDEAAIFTATKVESANLSKETKNITGNQTTNQSVKKNPDLSFSAGNYKRKRSNLNVSQAAYADHSSDLINEVADVEKNSGFESMIKLDAIKYFFDDDKYSREAISREKISASKRSLTRWIIYAGAGLTKSSYKSYVDTTDEYSQTIKGLNDVSFNGGIRFDASNRVRISCGFALITRGQERSGLNDISLQGEPMDPGNTYSINTGIGYITGPGSIFDETFYNSADSALFPVTAHVVVIKDTVKTRFFTLKEKFKYIEFPLMLTIKANEKMVTPHAGIIFSTGYLLKHSIELDDKNLNYDYREKLSKYVFSAGIIAGLDLRIFHNLDFFVNGFYEKNLNSVIAGDDKWKPSVIGGGAGFNYRLMRKK